VIVIAEFAPPDALGSLEAWKLRNAEALATTPEDSVRIDIGRADHPATSTFVRVTVAEEFAERFVT
jgi:hypothetical protein